MATPHDDALREMEVLLAAMSDGTLDDEGRRRLAQLVKEQPEARRLYLNYCQMHAMLRSAHGVLCALQPPKAARGRRALWLAAGLLAVATSLVIALVSCYDRAPRPAAAVVAVEGDVRVSGDAPPKPVQVGTNIAPGRRIQTGIDGTADLRLDDGTNIRVANNTDTSLVAQRNAGRVELRAGALECEIAPQPKGKSLVFTTAHAEVTVLGTAFKLSAGPVETRLHVTRGRVQLAAAGQSREVGAGEIVTADARGVHAWKPVCNLDFSHMQTLPLQLETVFCLSKTLHTEARAILPAPNNVRLDGAGLKFVDIPGMLLGHGLAVSRWTEDLGGDTAVEVAVSAGPRWSLGIAVDGDSFEGYRVIFASPRYPNGIEIDSLYPSGQMLLAQDPRPIALDRDHVLRVEKLDRRIRVWVDGELRIDTELRHPLPKGRRRTFAISNFGEPPSIRSLRVWRVAKI